MAVFQIGDRVITGPKHWYPDLTGTIVSMLYSDINGGWIAGVDFDESNPTFHDCGGNARPHHGRYIEIHQLIRLDDPENVGDPPDLSSILDGV